MDSEGPRGAMHRATNDPQLEELEYETLSSLAPLLTTGLEGAAPLWYSGGVR